ncbi:MULTISPECIES: hypothetical protein [unclassified Rhodococcus (in: high G+C Gram-positive bacteria)]|uniref:hypothetical protein n=1 Tax=unclassified Rhodococcus (in: high G+C Gram-positive bacteria) TaxID=192944 RepID=UPI000E0B102B|nr:MULTISPECIES: hypothetical protein [unclassified Rhodococcus (in: high G+C Gram-positive bacteria)]QKT13207.1 hypothetical protein HUN07_22960 [Rhodococcus sp. W8901]RDI26812.1 hypothetical protein DEU38_10847 [Rhodococcus sp. AG1013]
MKFTKLAATSALVIAAMGVGAGTSYAAPAQDAVGYEAHIDGRSVVTVLDAGGFHVTSDGKFVEIKNDAGTVLQALPLSYRIGDREFSIAPVIEGRQLALTPETDPAKSTPVDVAGPALPPMPIDLSMLDKLVEGVDSAVTVGTIVGTLVGAVAGCAIGGAPLALTGLGIPASVLTCLGGAAAAAPVGGMIGTILAAGPVLAYNGWQVFQTMNPAPAPAA